MNATSRPRRDVPPGGTPLRELAHAIAAALTLPDDAVTMAQDACLRVSRDRARVVLFNMRRILADREIDDSALMGIVADIRYQADQLGDGDASPADPFRPFVDAIIAALTISPTPPTTELAYLQSLRQRARRVLLACRRAVEGTCIEDADLAAAAEMLAGPADDDQASDLDEAAAAEMIP